MTYDDWKTTPPNDYTPEYTCCGRPIEPHEVCPVCGFGDEDEEIDPRLDDVEVAP